MGSASGKMWFPYRLIRPALLHSLYFPRNGGEGRAFRGHLPLPLCLTRCDAMSLASKLAVRN